MVRIFKKLNGTLNIEVTEYTRDRLNTKNQVLKY